jgi:Tfp pilus assembly protein PilX
MPLNNVKQQGMALIMSLIMVVIIAMIGIAIAQQVTSGRKSSAVHQDHSMSFSRATSGVNEAEFVVRQQAYHSDALLNPDTPNNLVAPAFNSDTWWQDENNWSAANKMTVVTDAGGNLLAGSPRYIIEDGGVDSGLVLGVQVPKRRFLRITSKAEGEGGAVTYLQSYVAFME